MLTILVSLDQIGHDHFWPRPPQYFLNAKNQAFSSFCSGDIINLKTYNLIGQEHFGPYLRNQIFPKYGISARIQQIIWTFFTDQIKKKLMTKCSNKSKKTYFWPIFSPFSPFSGQKIFLKKSGSVTRNNTWACNTMMSFTKNFNNPIQRKHPERKTEGRTDRP